VKGKSIEASVLLDIYGSLLTEKQRETLDMYLNYDYSLAEIAENQASSRQAAQDTIKKSLARLEELEEKMRINERLAKTEQALARIEALTENGEIAKETALIRSVWEDKDGI